MLSADFWQDKNNSQRVIKEKKFYEDLTNSLNNNVEKLKDLDDLNQLALEEENLQVQNEVLENIKDLRSEVKKNEIKCFLSNEADPLNCYIEIHAGAGGTESQDWADMLRRMYLKWSDKKNFKSSLISEHRGDEAGIKSATIKIDGDYVFGWLKKESGIHRLVRISPFDSGARRHTSFASVWIYPVVDENINIEILEKDLRIDTYRSSGAGGQHVNTTDSAVRITHIPSKIVVQCQNERSQHKNKETCMNMLKARLYDYEIKKKEQENINIEILEKDLRIDTYRSSGAGGQHVNTTDSAVRITHIPSKIVVQCQNERSQHKNKETCMNMLKARLYDYEIKKREEENQNVESSKSEIGWGYQIRSYVLQPYRLVKDNRTNFESTSPHKVLDGDIDEFLEQSLYKLNEK